MLWSAADVPRVELPDVASQIFLSMELHYTMSASVKECDVSMSSRAVTV